jgi:hypothetical protein
MSKNFSFEPWVALDTYLFHHALIKRDLIKAEYIPVKTEEFLTRTAHVTAIVVRNRPVWFRH